jgi:hypothetical protein
MTRAALAAMFVAACSHPHPHPEGAPTPKGTAEPVEAPVDAGAPAVLDAAPAASATPDADEGGYGLGGPTGGTTPGTIGTGKYGTIGGGCGGAKYPSGYGVGGGGACGGGRTGAVPAVTIGTPSVSGGQLDKTVVRRYLRRNSSKFLYCYEKDLLARPGESGGLALTFAILPDGAVTDAKAVGVSDAVADCARDVAKMIEYPKPTNGKRVDVTVSFTYQPTSS